MRMIAAIAVSTMMILITAGGFLLLARPLDTILDAVNASMYSTTGGTGTGWSRFNSINLGLHRSWLTIGALMVLLWIVFIYLLAQQREYVTGGPYY